MTFPDLVTFLQERTALSILSTEILAEIAPLLKLEIIGANETIVSENSSPESLYILKSGHVESNSETNNRRISLLSGSILNLNALLFDRATEYTVKTLSEIEVWLLKAEEFKNLIDR